VSHSNEAAVAAQQVREQLQRILASRLFTSAKRLHRFLEFVVTGALDGAAIKESLIGVAVYGRDPSYDPKTDSIVRAEASRLRAKLLEYYEGEGRADPVRIELPKGSYHPVFRLVDERGPTPIPEAREPGRSWWKPALPVAAAAVCLAGALLWWWLPGPAKTRSIAIAPLQAVGSARPLGLLGSDLTAEIRNALLAAKGWKVTGLAPDADLTAGNQTLRMLREQHAAEVVLTGSVRGGEKATVRVDLQLVSVADGYLLWTRTYHSRMAALAESQKDFATNVVEALDQQLTGQAPAARSVHYARARELWSAYTEEGLKQSLPLFEKAIAADSGFAAAWAGMADAQIRLSDLSSEIDTHARVEAARKAALRAIALDDGNAEAHATLGRIYLDKEWNFRAAVGELRRAVVLDPMRLTPNLLYSRALSVLGDLNTAEEAIGEARARLPEIPELLFQQGTVCFLGHKFERMDTIGRELIALAPNRASGYWLVGVSQEQRGRVREAVSTLEEGLRQAPKDDLRTLCALAHAYGKAGDAAKALSTMRRFVDPAVAEKALTRFTLSYCAALTYASLGDADRALTWLDRARRGKDASFPFFARDPRFDPLRNDPRYQTLAASLLTTTGSR
jgi:tetratricopeptide (TPR) repeat protein